MWKYIMSAITRSERHDRIDAQQILFAVARMLFLLAVAVGTWILVAFITKQAAVAAGGPPPRTIVSKRAPSYPQGAHAQRFLFRIPS